METSKGTPPIQEEAPIAGREEGHANPYPDNTDGSITLAEQLAAREREEGFLPYDEAWVVAHEEKPFRDVAFEARQSVVDRESSGVVDSIRQWVATKKAEGKAKRHEWLAETQGNEVEASLAAYKELKWYAPVEAFYNQAIDRAKGIGDEALAEELEADKNRSHTEAFEHSRNVERSPIARLAEKIGFAMTPSAPYGETSFTLTGGNHIFAYRDVTRRAGGHGAQGEGGADMQLVRKTVDVLGLGNPNDIPDTIEKKGDMGFGLAIEHYKQNPGINALFGGKLTDKRGLDGPKDGLQVTMRFLPESVKDVGEELAYHPERVEVVIRKREPAEH